MEGPFSFSEVPEEYLDFMKEKRRQMVGLVFGATAFGAASSTLVAAARGEPEEAMSAVLTMAVLLVVSLAGLGAYGLSQGGDRREA
mmetsp:Transcript_2475/g.4876  ORF Transcript_2475/g.4876 Transcript_2475/m.4876 type:complete len:86 (+) Transcript_2475:589-846(+)